MHIDHQLLEWISCISHTKATNLTYRLQVKVEQPTAYAHACVKSKHYQASLVSLWQSYETQLQRKINQNSHRRCKENALERRRGADSGPDCLKPRDVTHQKFLSLPPLLLIDH